MSTAFKAISLVNCPRYVPKDAMEALLSPIFMGDQHMLSGVFRISDGVLNTTRSFGNKILIAAKSHPIIAVVVAVITISGIVWYIYESDDAASSSVQDFLPEQSNNEVADEDEHKDNANHRNSSNHPLKGGSIKVVYPSITSDKNTQRRVLGVCCICLDQPADTLTLPCKHRAMCSKCFSSKKISLCPIDRQKIEDCLKIV